MIGALAAARGSEFDELHVRLLLTAFLGLLATGTALTGIHAVEEGRGLTGWASVAAGVVAGAVFAVAIWWEGAWDEHAEDVVKLVASAFALVVAALVVALLRRSRARDEPLVRTLAAAVSALAVVTSAAFVALLWASRSEHVSNDSARVDVGGRLLTALAVLVVAGFFVAPALARALDALTDRGERVDGRSA